MAISRPSSDRRSTRAIRAGTSGRFDDSEESYGNVTHRGAPERQSLLEQASNPPRETSSVSKSSVSWRRGPGQRKRTGSLSCARRCSRRSVGITVSTGTARGNRNTIPRQVQVKEKSGSAAGSGSTGNRSCGLRLWVFAANIALQQSNVLAFGLEWAQLPVG